MKRQFALIISLVLLSGGGAYSVERKSLTPEEQTAFLDQRVSGSMLGTFNSYCSLLFAMHDVAIHTESREIVETSLNSPFPRFYKPTWRELFDSVARQTGSTWTYDPERDYWVFSPPSMPLPFEIEIAEGWTSEDRGMYVFYGPPTERVGMDIYMMGTFSQPDAGDDLYAKIREDIALRFAKSFKEEVTTDDMSTARVGEFDALHFERLVTETDVMWRQWIIADSGTAIAIVSAIKPENEEVVFPDVEAMLASFTLKTKEPQTEYPTSSLRKNGSSSTILNNLVHIDASSATTQHPLVCGAGRDFPAGHEMTFRDSESGESVHAVFPAAIAPPTTFDGTFVLHGQYRGIRDRTSYSLKKPPDDYRYFVVSSWEHKE